MPVDFVGVPITSSSSSSSDTVYDCLSLDGEVIGDAPLCDGGVEGRSLVDVGEEGDAGLRKGEERGELRKEDCDHQPRESIEIVSHIPCCYHGLTPERLWSS